MEQTLDKVEQVTQTIEYAYSFVVYVKYNKNPETNCKEFVGFVINICISETESYNTICTELLMQGIEQAVTQELEAQTASYIVGYGQPPVSVLLQTYDPLICSLAKKQKLHWQQLEYEDLCQSCRLVLLELYNKGYYIHKSLLETSFNNYVLMSLRGDRNKPIVMSLDEPISVNNEKSSLSNIVPDEKQLLEREDKEENEAYSQLLTDLRNYVIAKIGQRQYDQLVFEYNSKTTSNWSQSMLYRLKKAAQKDKTIAKLIERYL